MDDLEERLDAGIVVFVEDIVWTMLHRDEHIRIGRESHCDRLWIGDIF